MKPDLQSPYSIWFDSAKKNDPRSQHSSILTNPSDVLTNHADFGALKEFYNRHKGKAIIAGVISYDAGRTLEHWPHQAADDMGIPDFAIAAYTDEATVPHNIGEHPSLTGRLNWRADQDRQSYIKNIEKLIDYIHEGDLFQACLAQRFSAELPSEFSALNHYLGLRESNPAPFGGFFNWPEFQIATCSPERFLKVENGVVETRPIKGTAAADTNPELLLASQKDRAENAMIVDILRNDLAKVCTDSSVQVNELNVLETYANVHHLVSTVTGELAPDHSVIDLLMACLPGGSISGAPKLRACEIIDELEPTRRGPYCGTLFKIDKDGNLDSNILIRTVIYRNGKAHCHGGGGITALSDPEKEYQETLDKISFVTEQS